MAASYPPPYGSSRLALPMLPAKSASVESHFTASSPYPPGVSVDVRELSRTPSPTPSEEAALHPEPFDPSKLLTKKFWFNKRMLRTFSFSSSRHCPEFVLKSPVRLVIIGLAVCFALTFTVYRQQIANALSPAATWMHK